MAPPRFVPLLRRLPRRSVYWALLLAVAAYVGFVVSDYDRCWMCVEVWEQHIPNAVKTGPRLVAADFLRGFENSPYVILPGELRLSFVSNLLQLLNVKFRLWLFQHLPIHPSLSLTWVLVALVSPLLAYQLAKELSDASGAWTTVLLYCLTTGFLSGLTYFMKPSKYLTNVFALLCFYLAARLVRVSTGVPSWGRRQWILLAALLGSIFLSFFSDEATWFVYLCLPIMFPALFSRRGKRGLIWGLYLSLALFFALTAVYLAPILVRRFGGEEINFLSTLRTYQGLRKASPWETFRFRYLIVNTVNLLRSQFLTGIRALDYLWFPLAGYLVWLAALMPPPRRRLAGRIVLTIILFIVFQSFLQAQHPGVPSRILNFAYYYGVLFSLLAALLLGLLLSGSPPRPLRAVNTAVLVLLMVVFAVNFLRIRPGYETWNDPEGLDRRRVDRGMVITCWRYRERLDELEKDHPEIARWLEGETWLKTELRYIPRRLPAPGAGETGAPGEGTK